MEGKKIRAICASLILCLAAMNISGCGSKDSESSANAVMGRVTKSRKQQVAELPESRGINRMELHRQMRRMVAKRKVSQRLTRLTAIPRYIRNPVRKVRKYR